MLLRLIKNWYQKMSLRERLMLIAFVWVFVLGWFGILTRKLGSLHTDINAVRHTLTNQSLVLSQQQTIHDNLGQILGRFDKANTIPAQQLFQMVAEFAKDSNLPNPSVQLQRVAQTSDIFKINTVTVHFSGASIHDLVDFASKIEDKTPYLAIDDMSLTPNPIRPDQLEASMRVSSLELNQSLNQSINPPGVQH